MAIQLALILIFYCCLILYLIKLTKIQRFINFNLELTINLRSFWQLQKITLLFETMQNLEGNHQNYQDKAIHQQITAHQEVENHSQNDTNPISINTSEEFENIGNSISQEVSSVFNNIPASQDVQQKQQESYQRQEEEKPQPYQKQEQQQDEQQTQQIKPQNLPQEKPQVKQKLEQKPQVDYETIISVKIFQKKINDALELKNQGNQFFKAHQYQSAIDKYSAGMRLLDPQQFYGATQAQCQKMAQVSASLLFNIGSCFFNISSWKKAEIYFTETITINSQHIKAIYKRALCRYELQNYEDAMSDIKLAFSKDKKNIEVYKSYEKILQKYNEQVKKDKQNLKEMSSKIFRTQSQKSIPKAGKQQQDGKQGQQEQSNIWGIATPLILLGGAALFFGYKKWFGK